MFYTMQHTFVSVGLISRRRPTMQSSTGFGGHSARGVDGNQYVVKLIIYIKHEECSNVSTCIFIIVQA